MTPTPECIAAFREYEHLMETLGDSHPATTMAMMVMLELAPDELKTNMRDKAKALGLLPEPDGYLDDGTPCYRLEDVANVHGVTAEEAQASMDEFLEARGTAGLDTILIDSTLVNRRQ
jgi:ABC-type uncharacterized transport system ATPase subunit